MSPLTFFMVVGSVKRTMPITAADNVKLEQSWKERLLPEFTQAYMVELKAWLAREYQQGKVIYPRPEAIFRALDLTPFDQVKVVILGQDPYHGPGQAQGLCFSVPASVAWPPSLQNIFTELVADTGVPEPTSGDLTAWARQGVLLLNATLTVEQAKAGAHQGKGWERFTDVIVKLINDEKENVVFILWGKYAQEKGGMIDEVKHKVLRAPHPSPLSAYQGFFGSRPFSQANEYLLATFQQPIDWRLD